MQGRVLNTNALNFVRLMATPNRDLLAKGLELMQQGGSDGERGAASLFDLLWPKFVRDFQKWGQPLGISEELASDAMLKVLHGVQGLRDAVAFEKWANTVARNTFLSHIRDTQPEADHETTLDEEGWDFLISSTMDPSQSDPITMICLQGQLEKFFRDHPERAHVIERCALDGWSLDEASHALGRTLAATKEYLSQCRKRLMQYLQPCLE